MSSVVAPVSAPPKPAGGFRQKIENLKSWVDHNIFGSDEVDYSSDPEMTRVQQKRLLGMGAAGGAAVGGVIGGVAGYASQMKDQAKEVWVPQDINDPSMDGYSHTHHELGHYETYYTTETRTYTDSDGNSHTETYLEPHQRWEHDGWAHRFSPNILERRVGEYKTPTFEHTNPMNLLTGTMVGIGIGAASGTIIGAGAAVLLRWARSRDEADPAKTAVAPTSPRPPAPEPSSPRKAEPEQPTEATGPLGKAKDWVGDKVKQFDELDPGTRLVVGTTAGGAAVGGLAGYIAGYAQSAKQTVITRTYPVPDLVGRHLGQVPTDFNEYDYFGGGWWGPSSHVDGDHGWTQVYRNAPHYDPNGQPVMKPETTTISSRQFGPVLGTVGGMALGAGVGFLGGVAINVLTHFKDRPDGERS